MLGIFLLFLQEGRQADCWKSSVPFLASSGPFGCPLSGTCLLPTCSTHHTPAYMAFSSLRASLSSASSPCNLCFSSSSEALALRASSLRRAVNSSRAAFRTGYYTTSPHGLDKLFPPLKSWWQSVQSLVLSVCCPGISQALCYQEVKTPSIFWP